MTCAAPWTRLIRDGPGAWSATGERGDMRCNCGQMGKLRRLGRFDQSFDALHVPASPDRHAKVQLKKEVRGVRPIERELEGRDDAEAKAARSYCAAVRSALTDDGRPPLDASGLNLRDRLGAVAESLDRMASKRGYRAR